jgi:hypothetical protein
MPALPIPTRAAVEYVVIRFAQKQMVAPFSFRRWRDSLPRMTQCRLRPCGTSGNWRAVKYFVTNSREM